MVEPTHTKTPAIARAIEKIQKTISGGPTLLADEINLRDVSRELVKMPDRQHRETVSWTVDALFEVAKEKVADDKSKEVIANLRKLVA
jgi:hypothetical protein